MIHAKTWTNLLFYASVGREHVKDNTVSVKSSNSQTLDRKRLILLVDDDEAQLEYLSVILKTSGYNVVSFQDAITALQAIRGGVGIDLVITDHCMPVMSGLEFVKTLRCMLPAVPVIMLTAHVDIDSFFRAINLGIFEYINKPVSNSELLKIVRVALATDVPGGIHAARKENTSL